MERKTDMPRWHKFLEDVLDDRYKDIEKRPGNAKLSRQRANPAGAGAESEVTHGTEQKGILQAATN